MEKDGRTARPRDFSSPEAYRVSRRAFKKLIDTPALTKMTVLLGGAFVFPPSAPLIGRDGVVLQAGRQAPV